MKYLCLCHHTVERWLVWWVGGVYGSNGAVAAECTHGRYVSVCASTCASNAAVAAVPTGQIYWSQYWRTMNRTPLHKVCAQRMAIEYWILVDMLLKLTNVTQYNVQLITRHVGRHTDLCYFKNRPPQLPTPIIFPTGRLIKLGSYVFDSEPQSLAYNQYTPTNGKQIIVLTDYAQEHRCSCLMLECFAQNPASSC